MIFKIVFNNEIHRIRANIATFQQLQEAIATRLPKEFTSAFSCEYKDTDGDKVRMNCDEDFSILLEELEDQKTVKIFVKEDLTQTMDLPTNVTSEVTKEVLIFEEPIEAQEIKFSKTEKLFEQLSEIVKEDVSKVEVKEPEPVQDIQEQEEEEMCIEKDTTEEEEEAPEEPKEKKDKKNKKCWKKKCWDKKKKWIKARFDKKFDEAIQNALPQIAVHVAQILRNDNSSLPVKALSPQKVEEVNANKDQVVHKGYVCDGCGTSPIVGVCYKCSVCKDFDFCAKCEDTIPHPHPFLKLKSPKQRPHVLFTAINEEGQTPFVPERDLPKMLPKVLENASGMLGQMFGGCQNTQNANNTQQAPNQAPNLMNMFQTMFGGNGQQNPCNMMKNLMNPEMMKNLMNPEMMKNFMNPEMMKNLQQFACKGKGNKQMKKMMKHGCKFFKKFMKKKGMKCPMFCKMMNKKSEAEENPLSYDEQIQQAIKLSLQDLDVTNNKKEEEEEEDLYSSDIEEMSIDKETKETNETPKPKTEEKVTEPKTEAKVTVSDVTEEFVTPKSDEDVVIIENNKPVQDLSFEEQMKLAMKQSLKDLAEAEKKEEKAPEKKPEPVKKPVVVVEDVDPIVLANTTQLMDMFSIAEDKKSDVMKWVKSKKDVQAINVLLNLFMDEMMGRF